jgi:hypothetical protein
MERLDKKVRADMNELKGALLDKLAEIDVDELTTRLDRLETSITNIEHSVTRVDTVVEGPVEAAPGFVTRRVRDASQEIAEELPA